MTSSVNVDFVWSVFATKVKFLIPFLGYYCWIHERWLYLGLLAACCSLVEYNNNYKLPSRVVDWRSIDSQDIALVTGGSSGLGFEIVKDLLKTPIKNIIVLDIRDVPMLDKRIETHKCDIGDEEALISTVDSIIAKLNAVEANISIIVNNAGVRHKESLLGLKRDQIRHIFNVNTYASIWILKSVMENHIKNIIPQKKYSKLCVVSVSSVLGVLAPKNLSIYSASKASTIQIHEALTSEMSSYPSIRLLLVLPGQLTTGMFNDVTPPHESIAPLVDHRQLARGIVSKIQRGERGVFCIPLYANFLPIVKILPICLQDLCRKFSRMDEKIKEA